MKTLIVGLGNRFRRDDAVGLAVAAQLKTLPLEHTTVLAHEGDLTALLELWQGYDLAVLIDATFSKSSPGTIRRFEGEIKPQDYFTFSTHAFDLSQLLELAKTIKRLPPKLLLYGIEGESYEFGEGLSDSVSAAVARAVKMIVDDLKASSLLTNLPRPDGYQQERS